MIDTSAQNVIRKTITVSCNQVTAFHIWTDQISLWWPKEHSVSGNPQTTVFLEGVVGGRLYEQTPEGAAFVWGEVVAWDPPHHLAYHWYLGSNAKRPTHVEVRFTPLGADSTRVDVAHQGPELIGDLWFSRKTGFNRAWEQILPLYTQACE